MPAPVSAEPQLELAAEAGRQASRLRTVMFLLALAALALAVHGYHLGVEDGAIYVPAIKKNLNPSLYPLNSEFFLVQTQPMLFDELVAWSIKLTHLPFDLAVFLWHVLAICGFLWVTLRLARICFAEPAAHWSAMLMITALMTMPVAGTRLYIFDQYLHPRSLSSIGIILAAADVLEARWWRAGLWILIAFLIHPQMAFLGGVWLLFLGWRRLPKFFGNALSFALPFGRFFEPTNATWREAMESRDHYFVLRNWTWYEWLGAAGPLVVLYLFSRIAARSGNRAAWQLGMRTALFGLLFLLGGITASLPVFIRLAPAQPMRALHLVYFVMLLLAGGLLGKYVLRHRPWRWVVVYLSLCIGLFIPQRALFAGGEHIEWPGAKPRNAWVQAFQWARDNTSADAIFALAPDAMEQRGEDFHGFRALAERSMLADATKDAGVASFSPTLSQVWHDQVHTLDGWASFSAVDFHRLREKYNVTWVMVARSHPASLDCPFQNAAVRVCRIE